MLANSEFSAFGVRFSVLIMSKFSLGLCYLNYRNGVFGRVHTYFLEGAAVKSGGAHAETTSEARGSKYREMCTYGGDFSELGNLATSGEAQRAVPERGENNGWCF